MPVSHTVIATEPSRRSDADADFPAGIGVLDRVVQQVGEHPMQRADQSA